MPRIPKETIDAEWNSLFDENKTGIALNSAAFDRSEGPILQTLIDEHATRLT